VPWAKGARSSSPSLAWRRGLDEVYHQQYNEALIRKLEDKMVQLEEANRSLELDLAARKEAEEALRESEEKSRLLAETSPFGIYAYREKFVYVNPAFEALTGYTVAELLGMNFWELVHPDSRDLVRQRGAARLRGEKVPDHYEIKLVRKDGDERWIDAAATMVQLGGEPTGIGILADITVHKQAEEALHALATRQKALLAAVPDIIMEVDNDKVYTWANQAGIEFFGQDVIGKEAAFYFEGEQDTYAVVQPVFNGDEDTTYVESWQRRKDGQKRLLTWWCRVLKDDGGNVTGALSTARDITERKQAEEALRRSEAEKSLILDSTAEMFAYYDLELRVRWANKAAGDSVDQPPEALVGRRCYEIWHGRGEPCPGCPVLLARETGLAQQKEMTTPDGRVWQVRGYPIKDEAGSVVALIEFTQNITERKQAEEALRESEARYRLHFENVSDVIYSIDSELKLIDVSPSVERLLGYKPEELIGKPFHDLNVVAPAYLEQAFADAMHVLGGEQITSAVYQFIARDGTKKWGEVSGAPLVRDGHVVALISVARDITERKQAEEELRRLKEFNEGIVQSMAEGIVMEDAEGTITFVNPAAATLLGYAPEELLGQHWTLIVPPDRQPIVQAANERRAQGQTDHYELELVRKDGARLPALVSASPRLRSHDGHFEGSLTVFTNLSELKRLEEQFLQAQKMEAVGRLAGGIAHDFNNLLTVIHLSTRLLERELHPQDPLRAHVQRIQEAGQRAANLTKQLLAFSRREIAEPQMLNLNQVLGGLNEMLQRLIGEDMELTLRPAKDLWPVRIDPTQAEQVVINLAVNARDAMPGGGKLTVETANVVLDEAYTARHLEVQPGEYVLLAVSDTGQGMSDEVKAHLFEPFFTTKELGKGTGLGLATVFGIVKQNQGHIGVYSELGQGTTFKIYLPLAGMPLAGMPSAGMPKAGMPRAGIPRLSEVADGQPASLHPPAQGTETLLLVEDEPQVRELTHDILLDHGYRVLTAGDGVEALRVAQAHEGPIHLLLTDVIMPRMSGKELADRLRTSRPEVRVLFTSGYTDNAIAHHGVLDEGVAFLSKPFEVEALARKVRSVLDGSD
jgi:two-component system cell cycle sensor histidine kinase/response regulator CckA